MQRFQDRAAEVAVLLQQHCGRQVARRGVDGVAEQQELHHRDHHDHRERHAVAPELDELLDHHRIAAPPEAEPGLADLAAWASAISCDAHWKLSFERVISSMNTSSSDGAVCCQCSRWFSRQGAMVASSAALSRPETCRRGAERRHHVDAGLACELGRERAADRRRSRCRWSAPISRSPRPRCRAPADGRRRYRRSRGSARPRPCNGSRPARSARRLPAHGSRSRNRAAPWDRRRRSARPSSSNCGLGSVQAPSASRCFQPPESSPASCSSRPLKPEPLDHVARGAARVAHAVEPARRIPGSRAPTDPDTGEKRCVM